MAFPKLALLLALAVGARAADDDQVVVGQTFMAGAIDPTSGSTGWALTSHGISEKLFTVDKDGNIVGQVADSVDPDMPKKKECHHHEYVSVRKSTSASGAQQVSRRWRGGRPCDSARTYGT